MAASSAKRAKYADDKLDDFERRILEVVQSIPRGKVASYGQCAALAGKPRNARQVGSLLNRIAHDQLGMVAAWQRVVSASGKLNAPCTGQREMLLAEGVKVVDGRGSHTVIRSSFWQPSGVELGQLAERLDPGTGNDDLVDCSKVLCKADAYGGAGAFARIAIAKGDEVERRIVRILTDVDGNVNPYVFTWSTDKPNTTWAVGSGTSTFYNTCAEAEGNVHMHRDFSNCTFVINATKDIAAGDELLHPYMGRTTRTCFVEGGLSDI